MLLYLCAKMLNCYYNTWKSSSKFWQPCCLKGIIDTIKLMPNPLFRFDKDHPSAVPQPRFLLLGVPLDIVYGL